MRYFIVSVFSALVGGILGKLSNGQTYIYFGVVAPIISAAISYVFCRPHSAIAELRHRHQVVDSALVKAVSVYRLKYDAMPKGIEINTSKWHEGVHSGEKIGGLIGSFTSTGHIAGSFIGAASALALGAAGKLMGYAIYVAATTKERRNDDNAIASLFHSQNEIKEKISESEAGVLLVAVFCVCVSCLAFYFSM